MTYYHGSPRALPERLVARYKQTEFSDKFDVKGTNVEQFVDRFKPKNAPSRLKCIYMVDNLKELNRMGASEEYVYEVKPRGKVIKADFTWIQALIYLTSFLEETLEGNHEAKYLAQGYWSGVGCDWEDEEGPLNSRPLWEYLTSSVTVIKLL